MVDPGFVTKETCDEKHRASWKALTVLFSTSATLVLAVGWSCWMGYAAIISAGRVDTKVDINLRGAQERSIRIDATLIRLENQLDRQGEKIDDLWKSQLSRIPKPEGGGP